jgi:O-antigen ligase
MTLSRPTFAIGLTPFAILAIGFGATRSPKYCALAVIALLVVVVTFSSLTLGLMAFTIVTFFNILPSGSALNLAKPTGFILTLSWLAALLKYRRAMPLLSRDHPVLTYLLVAFFAWAGISLVWADDVGRVISSLSRLALALIFVFIVHSTVKTGRELRILAWAFVVGTGLSALYGFAWGLTVEGRFVGGSGDANFMASVLVASIVICGFMLAATSSFGARLLLLALIALDFVALVRTQSRGGLIALAVAIVASCVLAGRLRARAVAISLVVVALGIGNFAVLAPVELRARATHISAAGSAGRTDLWSIAWQIAQHHPVNGVGLDNFQVVESSYVTRTFNILDVARLRRLVLVTHNTYLQLLAELGTVGLVLLTAVLGVSVALAIGALRALARGPDRSTETIARGITAGAIGVLTAYIFLSGLYEKQFWLLLGLLAALPTIAEEAPAPSSRS